MDPFNIFLIALAIVSLLVIVSFAIQSNKPRSKRKSWGSQFSPDISGSRSPVSNSAELAGELMDEIGDSGESGRRRSSAAASSAAVSSSSFSGSDSGGFSGGGGGSCDGGGGGGCM